MALVITNTGEIELLNKMLKVALTVDENIILKLFQNNVTPNANFAPGSLTEANFTNYAAKTLARTSWNTAVTSSGKAVSSYGSTPQAWTCGITGNTIYGYWIQGATSGVCLWAERFTTTRILVQDDVLTLQPQFTLNSEN